MKKSSDTSIRVALPVRALLVIAAVSCSILLVAATFTRNRDAGENHAAASRKDAAAPPARDSIASVKAFMNVYKVLKSPRCVNCHPAGDVPLQGDDSHLHTMSPLRGADGMGVFAMKCANCHQPTNTPGTNTPPGNPKWHLPPADMKMVFEGKTARQLATQILDSNQNGHKDRKQLLEHARDTLVKAGWAMGEGRKPPPLTYRQFLTAWDTWLNKGAFVPGK